MSAAATKIRPAPEPARASHPDRRPANSRMTSEVVLVTPAMAEKWLEANTHNRPVSDSLVERYAADMEAGDWKLTHQGIAFDESGTLADGQHRLWAIYKSQQQVSMMVSRNVPADALGNIDGHRVRSVADNLGLIDGVKEARFIASRASIVSQIERVAAGEARMGKMHTLSIAKVREVYERHRAGLDWSAVALPNRKVFATAPFAGALAWAWPTHHERIATFAAQVVTGESLTKSDPSYTLALVPHGERDRILGTAALGALPRDAPGGARALPGRAADGDQNPLPPEPRREHPRVEGRRGFLLFCEGASQGCEVSANRRPLPLRGRPAGRLRCPACLVGGYTQGKGHDGRPRFTCTACDYSWTAGKSGGEWVLSAVGK